MEVVGNKEVIEDLQEDGKKEVVDNVEFTENEEAISEECDREGDKGTESAYISDDDSSLRSLKLRRLDSPKDNSIRSADYHTTEAGEIAGGGQGTALPFVPFEVQRFKQRYLEVFSVKFVDVENSKLDEIYGLITIHTGSPPRLLFRRVRGDPSKIDPQGFAILEGPRRCTWSVYDAAYIVPFLFKYQELELTGEHDSCDLWCVTLDDNYDKLLCKMLDNYLGRIEVNYAVYKDSVQAHLSVMLTDCSFSWAQVHGTITASNSIVEDRKAVSFIFKKEKTEADYVTVGPGKEISLPLSRPVVALPLGSIFTVYVDISSEGESIIHQSFEVGVPLVGEIEKTFPGNGCGVRLKVKFTTEIDDYYDGYSFN